MKGSYNSFTFLRIDRARNQLFADVFPHPLDDDNGAGTAPLPLPKCWYRG